jgi:hypothetical protein
MERGNANVSFALKVGPDRDEVRYLLGFRNRRMIPHVAYWV